MKRLSRQSVVVMLFATGLVACGTDASTSSKKSADETPLMHASGSYLEGFALFKNNEDFAVKNCRLGLYSKGGDAYVLTWPTLAAHSDTGPITTDSFTKLNTATRQTTGEHFRADVKPDAWMMFCNAPTGETIGGGGLIK